VNTTWQVVETSLGKMVVMSAIKCWDDEPQLLVSGIPCFIKEEVEGLKALPQEARAAAFAKRVKVQDEEWLLRQQNPKRTVWG